MTPRELQLLADLRRRGQSPELAIFITDNWPWATKIEDLGCLAIRVRNADDHEHDWSPLAGMWAILGLRRSSASQLADFSTALLRANPARLDTFAVGHSTMQTIWPTRPEAA